MTCTWKCSTCDETETGDNWAKLDRAAEKHMRTTGHATLTTTTGGQRVREGGTVRDRRAL